MAFENQLTGSQIALLLINQIIQSAQAGARIVWNGVTGAIELWPGGSETVPAKIIPFADVGPAFDLGMILSSPTDAGNHTRAASILLESLNLPASFIQLNADFVAVNNGGNTAIVSVNGADVKLGDTGWANLTLVNGWVPFDAAGRTPRIRRLNGVVYMEGVAKNGVAGIMTSLPVGFRPAVRTNAERATPCNINNTNGFLNFDANTGNIVVAPFGANAQAFTYMQDSWIAES